MAFINACAAYSHPQHYEYIGNTTDSRETFVIRETVEIDINLPLNLPIQTNKMLAKWNFNHANCRTMMEFRDGPRFSTRPVNVHMKKKIGKIKIISLNFNKL